MSSEGGVDIEELSRKCPEKNCIEEIDISMGFQPFQARRLSLKCGMNQSMLGKASNILMALSRAFFDLDCVIAEINPLAIVSDGRILALDAKIVLDDNALFRHKDIDALKDIEEEDAREREAKSKGLSYVGMSGTIGLMVNGAGLAMATMDIIKLFGGEPANFLDVGGSGSRDLVAHAMKIILADQGVKVVLINIFGGIMRCDILAQGIIDAARDNKITVPIVARLKGTNVDLGVKLLKDSGINIVFANGMTEAAKKAVKLSTA
jgi:succinyl-CoA synthetase beta subunit